MSGIRFIHACILISLFAAAGCDNKPHCPEGQSLCWGICVDLTKDDDNCGQCDNQCDPHSDCVEGRCECNPGFTGCSGHCVNLDFDAENCGDCGNTCINGKSCYNGVCGNRDCESFGRLVCGDACIDPLSDNAHCGECYNACRDDQTCTDGTCECTGSLKDCDDVCIDAQTDPENCGECGNQCASNQFCVQGQCANVESSQLGDPCPFDGVHATANYCVAGLECLGIPADGNAGTCPGGESSECINLSFDFNPDCVEGNCGASFCSQECDHCGECPEGYGPQDAGSPAKCMCVPGYWGHHCYDACPWGRVNSECDSCPPGFACLGNDDFGECPSGCDDECDFIPENYNPDCVDNVCGFSFCSPRCDAQGNCPQEYQPVDVSGTCYCIPYNPGTGQIGDPCPYGDFNAAADQCSALLTCIGYDNSGSCPGGSATECEIPDNYNPDCVNGICGVSLCARRCGAEGFCPLGFVAQDVEGICYCVPIPPGNAQTGDPCAFGSVNATHDNCAAGLTCLGLEADGDSWECPSGNPAECTEFPATWNPDCVSGYCGFSYCAEECDAQGACQAGYEPQVVLGTCYCVPAN